MLIGFEPMSLPWEGSVLAARRWHHMVGEAGLKPAKVKTDGFTVPNLKIELNIYKFENLDYFL